MNELPEDSDETMVYRKADIEDWSPQGIPEDLRQWQPAVRLVRLVSEAAGQVAPESDALPAARRLSGILLWCLATGRYSSWDIEALCDEEPLARHLAGGLNPSHADIHRFRRQHEPALTRALEELVRNCAPKDLQADFGAEALRRYERARFADTQAPE
ncbi:MAG: hypothetical protein JNL10_01315 [Verrucomicrobiales bacterium]|nr:hypothetical protein [Verrucomicrobiales bacterium]